MPDINLYDETGRLYKPSQGEKRSPDYESEFNSVREALTAWRFAMREMNPFMLSQQENVDFMANRQWTDVELAHYRKSARMPLTINVMQTYGAHVSGMMRINKSGVNVIPIDQKTDPIQADTASKLIKHIEYNAKAELHDSLVFQDGLNGMGVWHIISEYQSNPLGNVRLERVNPFNVVFDTESIDPLLGDCNWCARIAYFRVKDLMNNKRWYSKINNLDFSEEAARRWVDELTKTIPMFVNNSNDVIDYQEGRYGVIEFFQREIHEELYIYDKYTGRELDRFNGRVQDISDFQQLYDMMVLPKQQKYIRKKTMLPYGFIVLEDDLRKTEYFDYVPFFSMRQGNKMPYAASFNGKMVGLQRRLNMRMSNMEEIIIRSLRGGFWIHENGDGKGESLLTEINQNAQKIGKSYVVSGGPGMEPKPITPSDMIGGLHYLEQDHLDRFREVTGLSVAPYGGTEQSGESGIHRAQRREESQTTIFPVLDDYNHAMALSRQIALERKIDMLTIPIVMTIVGENDPNPQYMQLTEEMIKYLKNVGKFDIRINRSPFDLERKANEQKERIGLTEFTNNQYGPGLIEPGDLWTGSSLPDAHELGKKINERWMAQSKMMAAKEEEQLALAGG